MRRFKFFLYLLSTLLNKLIIIELVKNNKLTTQPVNKYEREEVIIKIQKIVFFFFLLTFNFCSYIVYVHTTNVQIISLKQVLFLIDIFSLLVLFFCFFLKYVSYTTHSSFAGGFNKTSYTDDYVNGALKQLFRGFPYEVDFDKVFALTSYNVFFFAHFCGFFFFEMFT